MQNHTPHSESAAGLCTDEIEVWTVELVASTDATSTSAPASTNSARFASSSRNSPVHVRENANGTRMETTAFDTSLAILR